MARGVLGEIVGRKRHEVDARMASRPLAAFRSGLEPSCHSLRAALARPGGRFVLELKRRSPSRGPLRADCDPRELARAYRGVADAVSVLTDGPAFGGSFEDLRVLRAELDLPLLCKDFVLEPYQVYEARLNGADAVLLMLSVLEDSTAAACLRAARELCMEALVEVRDEFELGRALALGARLIGINNRDLATLEVDLATTERLAPQVPADRVLVSESGIRGPADATRLAQQVDALLVTGRVKVCGLTREQDLEAARAAEAAYGGLVFAPDSPRRVSAHRARELASASDLPLVGVFRDQPRREVLERVSELGLVAVQLHGAEGECYAGVLRAELPAACELWRVAPVDPAGRTSRAEPRLADRLLFDTRVGDRCGGSGRTFDWTALDGHARLAAGLLAGGIGAHNARRARALGTWALDLSSGVEQAPGIKSSDRLHQLFENLRPAARDSEVRP